jgi:hypothetical protein
MISQEERISAAIVIVLLAALVFSGCAVYALHREGASSAAGTARGSQPDVRVGVVRFVR